MAIASAAVAGGPRWYQKWIFGSIYFNLIGVPFLVVKKKLWIEKDIFLLLSSSETKWRKKNIEYFTILTRLF